MLVDRKSEPEDAMIPDEGLPISARAGCLLSLLLGLLGGCFLYASLAVAARGDLRISTGELEEIRIWIARDNGVHGLGFSSSRAIEEEGRPDQVCVDTTVRFLILGSVERGEGVDFCECYHRVEGQWISSGLCPEE